MKKAYYRAIMTGAILLAVAPALLAVTTGQINYQARLLDAYGRRINDTVSLAFKLYDAATAGNLLWSETHEGVVVLDGIYSIALGSTTPIPASVFTQDGIYLELAINNEIMAPRQLITSAGQALVARTVMGADIFVNQANGKVGIGTTTPAEQLDVAGAIKVTGFKLPTGATANYVLMSDGNGTGQWQPVTAGITETDPVFNAWSVSTYAPATADLWTAVGNLNASTNALNIRVNTDLATATNNLYNATNALNQNKLDRLNGTASNLTVAGTFVQAVAASTQVVAAAGSEITVTSTFIPIMSDGSDRTASINSGSAAGQIIILQGQDDAATVTLTNNALKVLLANGVNFTFKKNNTMQLIWNNGRWAELNRIAQP